MRNGTKVVSNFLVFGVIAVFFVIVYMFYAKYYFNDFIKAQVNSNGTSFYRDNKVRYSKERSYCIENSQPNDAVFYKSVSVEENTPYRVTCMVKTENVEVEADSEGGEAVSNDNFGACISMIGTGEQSRTVSGTENWQELVFYFNSKDSNSVDIGFRLGGVNGNCTGKAWFSDIRLEKGISDDDNNWNVACFIINNIDVTLGGKRYNVSMTEEDKTLIKENLERFGTTCEEFSGGEMTVTSKVFDLDVSLREISYDEKNGYFISPENVRDIISRFLEENEYDHIFVAIRMGDVNQNVEIPVNDWIGLGGMEFDGIGFSDIRMPNDLKNSYMYKYNSRYDTFPEEVFVHEFLHTLERNLKERNYNIPALHDNSLYGYSSQGADSLKEWYRDYMSKSIKNDEGNYVGLDKIVYTTKPIHESNFEFPAEIDFNKEPKSFFEGIFRMFKNIKSDISGKNDINLNRNNSVVITTD